MKYLPLVGATRDLSIDRVVVGFAFTVAATTTFGVATALLGQFRTSWTGAALIFVLAAMFFAPKKRGATAERTDRPRNARWRYSSPVALGAAACWLLWIGSRAGIPIILNRDPGGYLASALWLKHDGGLQVNVSSHPFFGVDGVTFVGPASYLMNGNIVEFQFEHGASVLIALATDIFGLRYGAAFGWLMILVGLYCVFRISRELGVGWPIAASLTAVLAVSVPVLYIARSTYSEPYVFGLLMTAGLVVVRMRGGPTLGGVTVVGFLVGATCLFRVDGLLYVAALAGAIVVVPRRKLSSLQRLVCLAALGPGLTIGSIDHWYFTGNYATDLKNSYWPLLILCSVCLLAALLSSAPVSMKFSRLKLVRQRLREQSRYVGAAIAVGAFFILWFAYFWRPSILVSRGGRPGLLPSQSLTAGLQEREGDVVDSARDYSELSLQYLTWYLGLMVTLGSILGVCILAYQAVNRRHAIFPAVIACLIAVPVYLIRLRIFPDQPWATRRLVPFVIPITVLAAAVGLDAFVRRFESKQLRVLVTATVVVSTLLPPALTTSRVRDMSDQEGGAAALETICSAISDGETVLLLRYPKLIGSIRGECAVVVGSARDVDAMVRAINLDCTSATVIGKSADLDGDDRYRVRPVVDVDVSLGRMPFQTLSSPVSKYDPESFLRLSVVVVQPTMCLRPS